jgi:hypothetical protein
MLWWALLPFQGHKQLAYHPTKTWSYFLKWKNELQQQERKKTENKNQYLYVKMK